MLIELGSDDSKSEAKELMRETQVRSLMELASAAGMTSTAFAGLGVEKIAALASDRIGKIVRPSSIAAVLREPEFTSDE